MTRMWMVPARFLCRNHLLGEHKELHQLVGIINKKKMSILLGHAKLNQIQTRSIISRHEELVIEMIARNYNHKSPLPNFEFIDIGNVNLEMNLIDLSNRCEECRKRINCTKEI